MLNMSAVYCFSSWCDKIPDKSNWKRKSYAGSPERQSSTEATVGNFISSAVKKQRTINPSVQLTFFFVFSPWLQSIGRFCPYTSIMVRPPLKEEPGQTHRHVSIVIQNSSNLPWRITITVFIPLCKAILYYHLN